MPKTISYSIKFILIFVAYFITAKVGLSLDATSGFATLVWVPTGISLAALVLFGTKLWPAIFLAAFLVNLTTGALPLIALSMGIGNTLEALIGSYFLNKYTKIETFLDHIRDVFYFVVFAAFISTAVSATIGVTSLYLGGLVQPTEIIHTWTSWWIGDMLGNLIFFPLLVTWSKFSLQIFKQRPFELFLFLITIICANLAIFFRVFIDNFLILPRVYLIFPILLWGSLRFEKRIVTVVIAVTSVLAIIATVQGISPFATAEASLSDNLLNLQTFIGVVSIMILSLSAVVSERKKATEELKEVNVNLDQKVREQTTQLREAQKIAHVGYWEVDLETKNCHWSDELYRIHGLLPQERPITFEYGTSLIHPDDRQKSIDTVMGIAKSGQPTEIEERIILPDKSVRVLYVRAEVLFDDNKKPIKIRGTAQDITQRKQSEDKLDAQTRRLKEINEVMVGRELKMIELEKEIAELKTNEQKKSI